MNRDGVLDMAATETWDQRVEELLPLGLSNLFFFDGEQVRTMALEGAATPEMQSAIQTLLGLALPARLTEDLGVLMRRQLKEGASSEVANEVPKIEAKLNALHERRAQLPVVLGIHPKQPSWPLPGHISAPRGAGLCPRGAQRAQPDADPDHTVGVHELHQRITFPPPPRPQHPSPLH